MKLFHRASALRAIPNLAGLAPDVWVTIRNAMAHGHNYFDPSTRESVFPDQRHIARLAPAQARSEATRMAFVNLTLAKTQILAISALIEQRASGLLLLAGSSRLAHGLQAEVEQGRTVRV